MGDNLTCFSKNFFFVRSFREFLSFLSHLDVCICAFVPRSLVEPTKFVRLLSIACSTRQWNLLRLAIKSISTSRHYSHVHKVNVQYVVFALFYAIIPIERLSVSKVNLKNVQWKFVPDTHFTSVIGFRYTFHYKKCIRTHTMHECVYDWCIVCSILHAKAANRPMRCG